MWNLVFRAELDELQKARWAEYVVLYCILLHFYCVRQILQAGALIFYVVSLNSCILFRVTWSW